MQTPRAAAALFDEERAKDIATFRIATKRRFWSTIFLAGALIAGMRLGLAHVPIPAILAMFAVAIVANWVLSGIGQSVRWYRPWFKYCFATCDTLLISGVVFLFGSPVLVLTYILAIVPYSFDRGPSLGYVTTFASTLGFLVASWGYAALRPADAAPWAQVLLAAVLLLVVAQQVIQMPSRLIMRIRRTRERMALVEQGELTARADARHADELGFLERSFNHMLDELTLLIDTVQREADALAAAAVQVHGAVSDLHRRAGDVSTGAHSLSDDISQQRDQARTGAAHSESLRRTATATHTTADLMAQEAHGLDTAAAASRAAIERASHTLLALGADVEATASRVRQLAPASDRVGELVDTVSRIARQTNLLALNAAIEASRAGDDGAGFAVVADEIRTLAVESAGAARSIATLVQRVRDDVAIAVQSMDVTASEVTGAGAIARSATTALGSMVSGISRLATHSDAVASMAQTQARLSADVAQTLDGLAASSHRASLGARATADSVVAQRVNIEELSRTAALLSDSAARMRAVALRHTAEYSVARFAPVADTSMPAHVAPATSPGARSIAA